MPEWIKRGSDLRAKCDADDWYCDLTIANRHLGFDLGGIMPTPSAANTLTTQEFDLRKYLSSRYLNPDFATNKSGLNMTRRL